MFVFKRWRFSYHNMSDAHRGSQIPEALAKRRGVSQSPEVAQTSAAVCRVSNYIREEHINLLSVGTELPVIAACIYLYVKYRPQRELYPRCGVPYVASQICNRINIETTEWGKLLHLLELLFPDPNISKP